MKSSILKTRHEKVDIIVPTWNNPDQLQQLIGSVGRSYGAQPCRMIIVNNGSSRIETASLNGMVKVIEPGKNLGWEGGLKEGLRHSSSQYVVFCNDDVYIPRSDIYWLRSLIREMENDPFVGAVGPTTNVVMGSQNIWADPFYESHYAAFLIGFLVAVRRSALDEVGGVDDSLPGGDDIDLSIRLRRAGYKLVVKKDVFVFHHGFQTGTRIFGGPDKPSGWNSPQMTERTNHALIQKHGFMDWWQTLVRPSVSQPSYDEQEQVLSDREENAIRQFLVPGDTVELGCGDKKTIPAAIGVDLVPRGHSTPLDYNGRTSVADVEADVQEELPFDEGRFQNVIARHVFEHLIDPVKALENWKRILAPGGRLVITVPDERVGDWIIVHPDHYHAYTPESLKRLCELVGLKPLAVAEFYNNISFTMAFEK